MLASVLENTPHLKEMYLADNNMQPDDGKAIAYIMKRNKSLEVLDLRNNNLQDEGLSFIFSVFTDPIEGTFGLICIQIVNNCVTAYVIFFE
jgi:Ran GTPase-activating protein (RanGAP) involved in mRNA processing and transport